MKKKQRVSSPIQNPVVNLNVTEIHDVYVFDTNSAVEQERSYRVLTCYPPNNNVKQFLIVDNLFLNNFGSVHFSMMPMKDDEAKALDNESEWRGENKVYKIINSIEPEVFFKHADWRKQLDMFLYQGIDKDDRIVDVCKSHLLPQVFDELTYQPINNHTLMFTNSGTGKSFFSEIFGKPPEFNPTEAGLLGGGKASEKKIGSLDGVGFLYLDEINVSDTKVLKNLLTYLETGRVRRAIHGGSDCKGVVTTVMCGNPMFGDEILLPMSFSSIIRSIAGSDSPDRIGRRFGLLLFGLDYKEVDANRNYYLEHRDSIEGVRNVINAVIMTYRKKYNRIFDWFIREDYENNYVSYKLKVKNISKTIRNSIVSSFVEGFARGLPRLVCGAYKSCLLDNLDSFVLKSEDDVKALVKKEIDRYILRLIEINLDSIKKLCVSFPAVNQKFFFDCMDNYPALNERGDAFLAILFGVSNWTIRRWRTEKDLGCSTFAMSQPESFKEKIEEEVIEDTQLKLIDDKDGQT